MSYFPCIYRLISRIARDFCVFPAELMIKSVARPCRITDQSLDCHRVVLFSRQCSQTSAGGWHRAQPQHNPRVHEGGALASEAGDMCRNPCFPSSVLFCDSPSGEESAPDGAEQAAAPGVVGHIVVAAPWRGEEVASMDFSCMTHISRSFHAILRTVSCHIPTIFTPFFVVQFHVFRSQFAILGRVFGAPCRVHDADRELHHL